MKQQVDWKRLKAYWAEARARRETSLKKAVDEAGKTIGRRTR